MLPYLISQVVILEFLLVVVLMALSFMFLVALIIIYVHLITTYIRLYFFEYLHGFNEVNDHNTILNDPVNCTWTFPLKSKNYREVRAFKIILYPENGHEHSRSFLKSILKVFFMIKT